MRATVLPVAVLGAQEDWVLRGFGDEFGTRRKTWERRDEKEQGVFAGRERGEFFGVGHCFVEVKVHFKRDA